jgi:ribulose-5-phosphate 4-epimerase/fuculose-1-phosphate aldolase
MWTFQAILIDAVPRMPILGPQRRNTMAQAAQAKTDYFVEDFSRKIEGQPKLDKIPVFETLEEERLHRKQRLAATFRIFCRYGFNEGVAGHVTVRDPIDTDTFWVNPFGMSYTRIKVSDLIRVDSKGRVVDGKRPVNTAAFAIHSSIHELRPETNASAHAHTVYGKAFCSFGKLLAPITQDACYFYEDHALFDCYEGISDVKDEGLAIANALGRKKAAILRNHGLITVGETIDECAYWMIAFDNACRVQMLAESSGKPMLIEPNAARDVAKQLGTPYYGWASFQALHEMILAEEPDFLD